MLASIFCCPIAAAQETLYRVSFPNAAHHEAEIAATFTGVGGDALDVVMSRSSPGRYAAAEFAKNVYRLDAEDADGRPLAVERIDPHLWRIAKHQGTVTVRYTLYGDHVDGTYAAIDESHAHLNMPAVFLWAHGYEQRPYRFDFQLPPGLHWSVATQLLPDGNPTRFRAPGLEWMMDSPVEISSFALDGWQVAGRKYRLALHAPDADKFVHEYAAGCKRLVREEEAVFGSLPKYEGNTYTFLADFLPYASGDGMEHRDSTVMTGTSDMRDMTGPLSVAAHEFFHSWNVKRIRPRDLEPFDFERANMSGELWFAEGFTSYYGPLALVRAGLITEQQFLSDMARAVQEVTIAPGRKVASPVEMSQQAPFVDAAVSIDADNFRNTFISYYTYGEALAFGIDLAIRDRFPGKSLDDWMRAMWKAHADIDRPYTLADLEATLASSTGDASFAAEIFRRHIEGREPLDYARLVRKAGLLLRLSHPGAPYLGVVGNKVSRRGRSDLDVHFTSNGAILEAETVAGMPFYEAGLARGDTLLSWEGKPLTATSNVAAMLQGHHVGDRAIARVRTRAGEHDVTVSIAEDPSLELVRGESASQMVVPKALQLRKNWLASRVKEDAKATS